MCRRLLPAFLVALASGSAASGCDGAPRPLRAAAEPVARPRPSSPPLNVIVVSMDALRYDRTGLGNHPTQLTPNLDRFAKEALVFHQAVSAAPWTVPSHMSMWTGRFPSRHGMVNKLRTDPKTGKTTEASLDPAIETYPDVLRKHGYSAAAFTGGAGVSARFGFGRGFETYLDDKRFAGMEYSRPPATAWLKARVASKAASPFFLFFHGYDVHGQHAPPTDFSRSRQSPDYRGSLDGSIEENARLREGGLGKIVKSGDRASLEGVISREDGRFLRDVYDAKVAAADRELGAFLDDVRADGLLDRSIVAIVSDHGDEFMEHGHVDHGHSLFEEQLHVVMMIRLPRAEGRRHVSVPVRTVDLFPTLFEALGLEGPSAVDGASLLAVSDSARPEGRPIFSESDYRLYVHQRAVREGSFKLVLNMGTGRVSLFDLAKDPNEGTDLAASDPHRCSASCAPTRARLESLLDTFLAKTGVERDTYLGVRESPITIF